MNQHVVTKRQQQLCRFKTNAVSGAGNQDLLIHSDDSRLERAEILRRDYFAVSMGSATHLMHRVKHYWRHWVNMTACVRLFE